MLLRAEIVGQPLMQWRGVGLAHTQPLRDGRDHKARIAERRQVDKDRSIVEVSSRGCADMEGKPRLAHAAWTGQCEEP